MGGAGGPRETNKRQPPCRIPLRLLAHLRRWHRLRFSINFVVEWEGRAVKRINKAFRSARRAAGFGPDVFPHTLRHTAASWGMQNGADHQELADYLGMTVETLRRVYGHHDPNYCADARDAIVGTRRLKLDRMPATEREQTSSNVVKLA